MKLENIKSGFEQLNTRYNEVVSDIKEFIRIILIEEPSHRIDFPHSPAFCIDEDCCTGWCEEPVFGIRLTCSNTMDISLICDHCTDTEKADFSDKDYIRSEFNHNCTINWISVLDSIVFTYAEQEYNKNASGEDRTSV